MDIKKEGKKRFVFMCPRRLLIEELLLLKFAGYELSKNIEVPYLCSKYTLFLEVKDLKRVNNKFFINEYFLLKEDENELAHIFKFLYLHFNLVSIKSQFYANCYLTDLLKKIDWVLKNPSTRGFYPFVFVLRTYYIYGVERIDFFEIPEKKIWVDILFSRKGKKDIKITVKKRLEKIKSCFKII